MKTLKQEIKDLKIGYEKIFKIDYENEYIIIRKSKLKGLEIYIDDACCDESTAICYEEIKNNFTEFSLYDESKVDY